MLIQRPRLLALSAALAAALAVAGGCKKDEPAAKPATATSDTAAPPTTAAKPAAPEARPELPAAPTPPPSLPVEPDSGNGAAPPGGDDRGAQRAARMDTDGDGQVSDAERAAAMQRRADMMRKRLDADGDGKLSPAEMAGARGRLHFDDPGQIDTNHDGDISAEELAAAMKLRNEQRRAARQGSGSAAPGSGW
jgi:hypothetical protein